MKNGFFILRLALFLSLSLILIVYGYLKLYAIPNQLKNPAVSLMVPDPLVGWILKGEKIQTFKGKPPYRITINQYGLRESSKLAPPVPLLFLGDSIVLGQCVQEENTFTSMLGAINGGNSGYSTMQIRDRYFRDWTWLQPKKAVLFVFPNDVITEQDNLNTISGFQQEIEKRKKIEAKALNFKQVFRMGLDPLLKDYYYYRITSKGFTKHVWSEWTQSILALRSIIQKSGAFGLVAVPPRGQIRAYQLGYRDFTFNRELKTFASEHNIPLIDLLADLSSQELENFYLDHSNLTEQGHLQVAHALRPWLNEWPRNQQVAVTTWMN